MIVKHTQWIFNISFISLKKLLRFEKYESKQRCRDEISFLMKHIVICLHSNSDRVFYIIVCMYVVNLLGLLLLIVSSKNSWFIQFLHYINKAWVLWSLYIYFYLCKILIALLWFPIYYWVNSHSFGNQKL